MTDGTVAGSRRSAIVVWRWHGLAVGLVVIATCGLVVSGETALAAVLAMVSAQVVLHGVLAERGRRRQQRETARLTRALHDLAAADRSGRAATTQRLVTMRAEMVDDLAQLEARVLGRLDLRSDELRDGLRDELRVVADDRATTASARAVRRRDSLRREAVSASTHRAEGVTR